MIQVDDRIGSQDLSAPLRKRGIMIREVRLPFGDISFVGNGPEGRPVSVGAEIKTLGDMARCLVDKRFAGHQLPGLLRTYESPWLIIEGSCRPDNASGLMQIWDGHRKWHHPPYRVMWAEFTRALLTYELQAGIQVLRTGNREETAAMVAALYGWWTGKDWEEHRAHLAFSTAGPEGGLVRHSLKRRWAKELPGIGYEKSKAVAEAFRSAWQMANASETEWSQIAGIGKKLAAAIYEEIRR